jgi:thiopurine S-methyltransferase
VKAFFKENSFKPTKQRIGKFMLWKCGKISILCGDYFSLQKSDLGLFDTVYDRAALTALSENVRRLYVAQLKKIVLENTKIFLLTIEDSIESVTENSTIEIDEEINALYSGDFEIDLAYIESVFEPDLASPSSPTNRADYKVYRLSAN